MPRNLMLPLLAALSLGLAGYHVARTQEDHSTLQPPAPPPRSPFDSVVAAAGIIEARSENIHVASPLAGTVAEVAVRVGEQVDAGQLLFRLDDRQIRAELAVRTAERDSAAAALERLKNLPRPEEIAPSEAHVERAVAESQAQEDLLARREKMVRSNAISPEELIQTRQALAAAKAALAQAQAEDRLLKAGTWEPDLVKSQADLAKAQAAVAQTEIELSRLEVRAPVAGEVLMVDVRPGEYVGTPPGEAPIVLGDMTRLHVRVEIDEQDIPRFHPGMPGRMMVRGGDGSSIELEFVRVEPFVQPKISLTGDPGERVDTRVLQAIYALAPTARDCYVGQQVDVFLDVGDGGTRSAEAVAER